MAPDNSDSRRLDMDNEAADKYPVDAYRSERALWKRATERRKWLGDVYLCLKLLEHRLPRPILAELPEVFTYVGADCSPRWLQYLQRSPETAHQLIADRLSQALGLTTSELQEAQKQLDSGAWSEGQVANCLEALLLPNPRKQFPRLPPLSSALGLRPPSSSDNRVQADIASPKWPARLRDPGVATAAAMPPRLRRLPPDSAPPSLPCGCHLCEASFPSIKGLRHHVDCVHGGMQRAREAWLCLEACQPHCVMPSEKRAVVENFSFCYAYGHHQGRRELAAEEPLPQPNEASIFFCTLFEAFSSSTASGSRPAAATLNDVRQWKASLCSAIAQPPLLSPERRQFVACAFCALQYWSEELRQVYIAGPSCFMKSPAMVAELLSADWYKKEWPLIPAEELDASAVDLPHKAPDGQATTTKVLMHKRRVSRAACEGKEPVWCCAHCYSAYKKEKPTQLAKYALSNYLWLGRHLPMFREASLGHQLLLALGRVVSTKVYLSSRGVEETVRQNAKTWRQRFLQSGIQGTGIVFSNGSVDEAMKTRMSSFPPCAQEMQDTFVAVFTGPEKPTDDEQAALDGVDAEAEQRREEMARQRMRREVGLKVTKSEFDKQARHLKSTNYVYAEATYRADLVDALPEKPEVPSCFSACARFVKVQPDVEDQLGEGVAVEKFPHPTPSWISLGSMSLFET